MKLQLLVTRYNEPFDVVENLLNSLESLTGVDKSEFGVIICNDGEDNLLDPNLFSKYSYEIQYYKCPHRGVSATRNACLDLATADYVMFCDCDDMFYTNCGLWVIFREINIGFDVLESAFVEEVKLETGEMTYITRHNDITFVHGKVLRRLNLIDKNIRWNDNLTIHEDSYFNCICHNIGGTVKYTDDPYYLWKYRADSVCRRDPKYMLKTFNNMIDSNEAFSLNFLDRGREDLASMYIMLMIYETYFTMLKTEWMEEENKDYRKAVNVRIKAYLEKYKDYLEKVSTENLKAIFLRIQSAKLDEGVMFITTTYEDWLKEVNNV